MITKTTRAARARPIRTLVLDESSSSPVPRALLTLLVVLAAVVAVARAGLPRVVEDADALVRMPRVFVARVVLPASVRSVLLGALVVLGREHTLPLHRVVAVVVVVAAAVVAGVLVFTVAGAVVVVLVEVVVAANAAAVVVTVGVPGTVSVVAVIGGVGGGVGGGLGCLCTHSRWWSRHRYPSAAGRSGTCYGRMSGRCPGWHRAVLVGAADNIWRGAAAEPVVGPATGTRALLAGRARATVACLAGARVGTESVLVGAADNIWRRVQLNPLLTPLQEPERCWPVGHVMRSHAWQVPGLAPSRYWLVPQTMFGSVVHVNPLVVPLQEPERCRPVVARRHVAACSAGARVWHRVGIGWCRRQCLALGCTCTPFPWPCCRCLSGWRVVGSFCCRSPRIFAHLYRSPQGSPHTSLSVAWYLGCKHTAGLLARGAAARVAAPFTRVRVTGAAAHARPVLAFLQAVLLHVRQPPDGVTVLE